VRPTGESDGTCLDEDFTELLQVHPSRRLTIAERNCKTRDGREPPELVDWSAQANEARRAPDAERTARAAGT
jgi:hypothetical protein